MQLRAVHMCMCVYTNIPQENKLIIQRISLPLCLTTSTFWLLSSHCGLLTVLQPALYHPELLEFVFLMLKIFSPLVTEKVHKPSLANSYTSSVRSVKAEACLTT